VRLAALALAALALAPAAGAHWSPGIHNTRHAVNLAFCGRSNSYCAYAAQAWAVAACESGHSVYAVNGQYLGLFQFGAWARSRYGFGWNPWAQSFAAARYWRAAGWAPWACRP
jgi:hypothetical protein